MATITFDTKDLVEESGVGDLDSAINKIGMEIKSEEMGEISIDITPNRPDLLDITGLGRALGNITGKRIREGGAIRCQEGTDNGSESWQGRKGRQAVHIRGGGERDRP